MSTGDKRIICFVEAGDIKTSIKTADHNGWILLDGRDKTSLTATQQAVATSLSIGSNLLDARNKLLMGASTSRTVGSVGGDNTIARSALPNSTLSGTTAANNRGHTHSIDPPITDTNSTGKHTHTIATFNATAASAGSHSHSSSSASAGGVQGSTSTSSSSDQVVKNGDGRSIGITTGSAGAHTHTVAIPEHTTDEFADHKHTVDIAAFTSAAESQNHTHTFTTSSLNGNVTQTDHIPEYIALNTFIYLGY